VGKVLKLEEVSGLVDILIGQNLATLAHLLLTDFIYWIQSKKALRGCKGY
jgi:hypothetical protein